MFYCLYEYKQYLMITETQKGQNKSQDHNHQDRRFLKIVRENPRHLILTDGKSNMIFKTYQILQPSTLEYLLLRKSLNHHSLLQIHKIEIEGSFSNILSQKQSDITCGILFEKYQKTLEESLKQMIDFSKEEIFETLQPIKEALQYLISCNYDPGHVNCRSIVCSQHYQVKFMENYLQQSSIEKNERTNFKTFLYEDFTNILFNLLFPSQTTIKSLKSRYEIAEKKLEEKQLKYFQDLYKKIQPAFFKTQKHKKIKKREKRDEFHEVVTSKHKKMTKGGEIEAQLRWQQGKQNKIIQ